MMVLIDESLLRVRLSRDTNGKILINGEPATGDIYAQVARVANNLTTEEWKDLDAVERVTLRHRASVFTFAFLYEQRAEDFIAGLKEVNSRGHN